ncbi:MAG: hypothetical protein K0U66_01410 [Gammaproteobacteria bacterium]|nr:hypothetical protein [Gammaproteobacteria bacterium]
MEITEQQIADLITQLLATNTTGEITAVDVQTVLSKMTGYTKQTDTKIEALRTLAQSALDKATANETEINAQGDRLTATEGVANTAAGAIGTLANRVSAIEDGDDGAGTLTPEQIAQAKLERDANTDNVNNLLETSTTQGEAIGTLQSEVGTLQTDVGNARAVADRADGKGDTAITAAGNAMTASGNNATNLSNHKTQEFDPLKENVDALTETIGTEGDSQNDGTGILGDVKSIKRTNESQESEIAEVRKIAEGALDADQTSAQDFIEEAGRLDAVNPDVRYAGVNGQDPTFAEITLPLTTQFTDLDEGRTIRFSNGLLFPQFREQVGAESQLYYVIEQGTQRISGRGNPSETNPTIAVVRQEWVEVDVESDFTELVFDADTGADPVIKFAMIWTGESGAFTPRLTAFDLHYIGKLRNPVADVVRDVVADALNGLEANDATQSADIAGLRADVDINTQGRIDNADLAHGLRARLDTPQFGVIENAEIIDAETNTIDPTALNTELGGGTTPFASQIDGAIGEATQFITRVTDASQVLDYGAGRVLDVYNGRVRGFILRPAQDARTTTETLYITTRDGLGTRARPAVLELGNGHPTAPLPVDNEIFLTQGIPDADLPSGQTISNLSMAFAVRTNGNWVSIPNTIQLDLRSGESRDFAIPNVEGVTFTATALADGRIQAQETHNGGGNPQALATNGAAIRFDVAYTQTTITPRVERGQETVDLGAFTGNNLVGFDAIQTGDNAEATAYYVTPTGRFNTGYYLLDIHRVNFATDNSAFRFLISDADTPLTQAVMERLVGADEYLGLFARNNHHADVLKLRSDINVPNTAGDKTFNVGDTLARLETSSGDSGGLDADAVRGLADEQIGASTAIRANTAKVGTSATQRANIAKIPDIEQSITNLQSNPTIAVWNATATYNTGDYVTTINGIYRAITDNVISAVFQPNVGSAWTSAWVLVASPEVGGTTDTEKADISRLVETVFGDTIAGIWDEDSPFDGSLAEANALQMGDIIQSMRADGTIEYYALAVQAGNFTTTTGTYYPDGGGEADRLSVWVKVDYSEGLVELVADNTTEAEAKAQAELAIDESLETDGAIELAIRNISPTGDGDISGALDAGAMQIDLNGSDTGNFMIPLPTDSLTQDSPFTGVLTINSAGGTNPSGYTYTTRYADGARETIFGATTAPFTTGGTVINLGSPTPYTITAGRPIEIDIGVNGGAGSTANWTLDATIGAGQEGALRGAALDLIQQNSYTDENAKSVAETAIADSLEEGQPIAEAIKTGAGGGGATPTISAFYVNAEVSVSTLTPDFANIVMATPSLNQGGDMATDGVYTAPETGVYWMSYRLSQKAGGDSNSAITAGLSVDGAIPSNTMDAGEYLLSGRRPLFVIWAGAIALTKGQTVRLQGKGTGVLIDAISAEDTYFSGYLIGATG